MRAASDCPTASRFIQRASEAAQSFAVTRVPSWNINPSRSFMVQRRPSFSTVWPSTICGEGARCSSSPYNVSNTIRA